MKTSSKIFCLGFSIALLTVFPAPAQDGMDPDMKAALDEAKKAAEGAKGGQMLDINKMMENAKKEAEKADAEAATPTPAPATKPVPLKALPTWIPPVPGFKASPGATQWTEAGMEKGKMTGTVSGAPRDVVEKYHELVKAANKLNVVVNDVTINGALTMTVFLTNREGPGQKLELTLKPSLDGKNSLATFEYSAALPGAKPAE